MNELEWLLLLPLAAACGWWAGVKWIGRQREFDTRLSTQYLVGINYLLAEQPDRAIDVFLKLIDVDSETAETHLALGALFRRRGEVQRALKIHQNLIARPSLPIAIRELAMYELGQDYFTAGMFDRAERVFQELVSGNMADRALRMLIQIHQQLRDWPQAIEAAEALLKVVRDPVEKSNLTLTISHYHCELAEQAIEQGQLAQAKRHLRVAKAACATNPRVDLLSAEVALRQSNTKNVLSAIEHCIEHQPQYFSLLLPVFKQLQHQSPRACDWEQLLRRAVNNGAGPKVLLATAKFIYERYNDVAAGEYLIQMLKKFPSVTGVLYLLNLYRPYANPRVRESLQALEMVLEKLKERDSLHRCHECGFQSHELLWQCPSCKQWGAIAPCQS